MSRLTGVSVQDDRNLKTGGNRLTACLRSLRGDRVEIVSNETNQLLDDLCFVVRYPESADRWISYRLVTAEWLTWLRIHYLDGKDPRTVAVLQDRQRRLRPTMKEFIPELVGATVELPDSYEPPPLDGVENARQ